MTYICYAKKRRINTEAILEATNPICNNRPPIQLFGSIFFFLNFKYWLLLFEGNRHRFQIKKSNKNLLETNCSFWQWKNKVLIAQDEKYTH